MMPVLREHTSELYFCILDHHLPGQLFRGGAPVGDSNMPVRLGAAGDKNLKLLFSRHPNATCRISSIAGFS